MAFNFRKSLKIAPGVKLNVTKKGISSLSVGKNGARVNVGKKGESVQNEFNNTIKHLAGGWENSNSNISLDDYILMLWMLSLAILLDIDDENFERIVKVLDTNKQEDYIFDILIAHKFKSRKINQNELYPKAFEFLKELFATKDIQSLKEYLDKNWYKKFTSTYWYDNDKNKNEIFFGYWSFESGALVKILGLDDSILKDQQYYPYDLVHFKN